MQRIYSTMIFNSLFKAAVIAMIAGLAVPIAADEQARVWNHDDPDLTWGPCPEFFPEGCRIGVLNGDPAQPNADIFFKLPANTEAPEHTHTSAERMVLVSGEMTVNYRGQDPVTLTAGSYAYGPPELPHSASCSDAGPCVLFIAFEQPVDAMPSHSP